MDEAYLLGIMSSIPFDWFVRRWVELNVTFEIMRRMPIPEPAAENQLRLRIAERAGRLSASDDRFEEWADAVGVPVGSLIEPAQRDDAIAEIDALSALLYGLSWDDVSHIFETFHRGWDYTERLAAVQEHYQNWSQT